MIQPLRLSRLLVALATLCVAAPARGQSPPSSDVGVRAVELGSEGLMLFQQGKFADAHTKFAAADAISPSPVFRLYIARSLARTGRLLAARDTYRSLAAQVISEDAPPPWRQAKADANGELAALEPRIPSIQVTVKGASAAAELTIDDKPVSMGSVVHVDPGDHIARVRDGKSERQTVVVVAEGSREQAVALDFGPSLDPVPAVSLRATEGSLVPGAVLTALGAAALITGAVTGGLALARSSDIKSKCGTDDGTCPAELEDEVQPEIDAATTLGHVSTGMLVGGGAMAAVGVVLLIVRPGGVEPSRASSAIWFAPTWGGAMLFGRF